MLVSYGTPGTVLTDNRSQFVLATFPVIRAAATKKLNTALKYHLQASSQMDGFDKTVKARLLYLNQQTGTNWDTIVPRSTYDGDMRGYHLTYSSQFSLVKSWETAAESMSKKAREQKG